MKHLKIASWVVFFLIGLIHHSEATHLRAGEITVRRVSCNGLTFEITIKAYTNTGSSVRFSDRDSGILSFGDGTSINPPQTENTIRQDLGPGIGYVQFVTTHVFPGAGSYVISYKERNRNKDILNMANSVETQFYLETLINIDPFIGCDNSPILKAPPIDKGCTGKAWYHNPGAYDPDKGDFLSYEFVVPKQDKNVPVNNYRDPNVKEFYDRIGLNYATSNEAKKDRPTFTIDPQTGDIVWDAPGAPGEYNIAFKVIQWRKIDGVPKQIGYVTRDMQIEIEDCKNERPELTVPQDICVVAGTSISETIFGLDPDPLDEIKIEVFSEALSVNPSPATFSPNPAVFLPNSSTIQFDWQTKCDHVREQPYQVNFKISDKPKQGPSLAQFKAWRIKVIGPRPVWKNLNVNGKVALLEWEPYKCVANATSMEVWRRVDSYPAIPGPCITGMPDSFGYTKIATLPIGTTTYTNTGLAAGAKYCYRLVAIFPLPGGGESIVSQEICLPPIKADRAVITKVSVDKTSATQGEIRVEWVPPFEIIPPSQFSYKLYRAEGFSGNTKIVEVFPNTTTNTFAIDNNINTRDIVYNYRVLTFDGNTRLDSSALASAVRLEIKPKFKELELRWAANVPWANNTFKFPTHVIYRGAAGATEAQFVKIAEVNVNQKGFVFTDTGLNETDNYCYRVETLGSYGNLNPIIPSPLRNFSQITCALPNPIDKPCKPTISAMELNCTDYLATAICGDAGTYSNTLRWRRPSDPACATDIQSYSIYYASHVGEEFKKLSVVVTDTFYVHPNPNSFAGCYKVSAIDRAGNESELSDAFCFDNCPYYELPNVFTPNGDKCNDFFSAYSTRNIDENGKNDCGGKNLSAEQILDLQRRCARFVEKVKFNVYNRWGGLVYSFESDGNRSIYGERTIYIDWDGRDNNKQDLSTGVYYYEAQVTFTVVDPSKKNRTIKGWVQVLR
jgi:CHU_C Type IX secretion signal domain